MNMGVRKKWTTVGLQEEKIGVNSKQLVIRGIRGKYNINKIGYFKTIPPKIVIIDRVY